MRTLTRALIALAVAASPAVAAASDAALAGGADETSIARPLQAPRADDDYLCGAFAQWSSYAQSPEQALEVERVASELGCATGDWPWPWPWPRPTRTPRPTPTVTATPEPTQTSTPEPTTPEPTQTSTPEPTTPEPTQTSTPEPTTPGPTQTSTPGPTPTSTSTTAPAPGVDPLVQKVFELTNQERAKAGVKPLEWDSCLATKVAQPWADQMAKEDRLYHQDLSNVNRRCPEFRGAGENIAMGYRTAEDVMKGWMNSEGHRANILRPEYTDFGGALAKTSGGTYYWVQNFGL